VFYRLCADHLAEITPLIYTPTVGDACLSYSEIFRRPEGLVRHPASEHLRLEAHPVLQYVTIKDKGRIGEILQNWPHTEEARIAVVTDGNACAKSLVQIGI
jgi:malate dehydrogenase (oxaloacetate-decarboxylating)(NADP+)